METFLNRLKLTASAEVNFLLILLGLLLLSKVADLFITRVLRRLAGRTAFTLDEQILDILQQPVRWGVILLGTAQALAILSLPTSVVFKIRALLYSVFVFVLAVAASRLLTLLIDGSFRKVKDITGLRNELNPLLVNLSKVAVIVAAAMALLSVWELDITPLLASAGIAGIAVALAAKETLANFLGGISIFIDRPYKIGDYIVLDDGERGEVVDIGVRSTRIKTRDDILISVPNAIMANTKIINQSAPIPNFRVRVAVGVSYGSDVDHVERVLERVAAENPMVLSKPEPRVRFRSFGDSALEFELLCWCEEPSLRGMLIHTLNKAIFRSFAQEKISIPFPQRDVHLRDNREASNGSLE